MPVFDTSVFKGYDIRGIVGTQLTDEFYFYLGRALAEYTKPQKVLIGYDARANSKDFALSLARGFNSKNIPVVMPTTLMATEMSYFASFYYNDIDLSIVVTASHNPKEYNGAKITRRNVTPVYKADWPAIIELMQNDTYTPKDVKEVSISKRDVLQDFAKFLKQFYDAKNIRPLSILIDPGNGVGGFIFEHVFEDLKQLKIHKLNFDPDPTFPAHLPDPLKDENIKDAQQYIHNHPEIDLTLLYDGDADRVFFMDQKGRRPLGNYIGSLIAKHLIKQSKYPNNRRILHDTRMPWALQKELAKDGVVTLPWVAGHSNIKKGMKALDSLFAAEISSHFFYKDFHYADSGLITTAVMLQLLSESEQDFTQLMDHYFTNYPNSGEINFRIQERDQAILKVKRHFIDGKIFQIDGVAIEYPDRWISVRKSNTEPLLRVCIEGTNSKIVKETIHEVQEILSEFLTS